MEFEFISQLHYVKISFKSPKFDKITKDRAAKFVSMLSAVGGTMGLLTGFSIISGVEIIYFAVKILLGYFQNLYKKKGVWILYNKCLISNFWWLTSYHCNLMWGEGGTSSILRDFEEWKFIHAEWWFGWMLQKKMLKKSVK